MDYLTDRDIKAIESRDERMRHIDSMEPAMRELVHAYGYHIVNSFLQQGIKKPNIIKHLVELVLDEFSPTRGTFSSQGRTTQVHYRGDDGRKTD